MILEEETYEKFGYYPSNLKPTSTKKILIMCDDCNIIRELQKSHYSALCRSCSQRRKIVTENTKQKLRIALTGRIISETQKKNMGNAKRGAHHTEETKKKMKMVHTGIHHTEETKQKLREIRKKQTNIQKHHTKPEIIFETICKKI